ncbi:MAG: PorV/PorQ family protein, partial [Candidatus Hydrogenedentota bacterium]
KKLYLKAKSQPNFRFYALYDKIYRMDVLQKAWRNLNKQGASGIDRQSIKEKVDKIVKDLTTVINSMNVKCLTGRLRRITNNILLRQRSTLQIQKIQRLFTLYLCAFVPLCLYTSLYAGNENKAGAAFLKIGVGAEPTALGGGYTALADDVHSLYWNPAGLGDVKTREVLFMHNEWFEGINYEYLGFVMPWHRAAVGFTVSYLDYGDMNRYLISATQTPVPTGTFSADDLALGLGYGFEFTEQVKLGIVGKYICEEIDDADASTLAIDVGIKYRMGYEGLEFGIAVKDIGDKLRFDRDKYSLPLTVRLGLGYTYSHWRIGIDGVKPRDDTWGINTGIEYSFSDYLFLRVGYDSLYDAGSGFTAGVGFKMDSFCVDYAYGDSKNLDNTHRFSLRYSFK